MADGILAIVNPLFIHDLLDTEGHEHGHALRGQGSHGIQPPVADGQRGIQGVELLKPRNGKSRKQRPW